jgi:hypothetical protein
MLPKYPGVQYSYITNQELSGVSSTPILLGILRNVWQANSACYKERLGLTSMSTPGHGFGYPQPAVLYNRLKLPEHTQRTSEILFLSLNLYFRDKVSWHKQSKV